MEFPRLKNTGNSIADHSVTLIDVYRPLTTKYVVDGISAILMTVFLIIDDSQDVA